MSEKTKKELEAIRQKEISLNEKLNAPVQLAKDVRLGEVATLEDYNENSLLDFQNDIQLASVSPLMGKAIAEVIQNSQENFPVEYEEMTGRLARVAEKREEGIIDQADVSSAATSIVESHVPNLPKVVTQAVMATENNGGTELTVNPTWHNLQNISRFSANVGAKVFSVFPCFEDNVRAQGPAAAFGGVNCMVHMEGKEGQRPTGQNQAAIEGLNRGRVMASKPEMDAVTAWILENGMVLDATEIKFDNLTPNDYSARIVMAATEDETYCLVQEKKGIAHYSYNPETGTMVIKAHKGRDFEHGDLLHYFDFSALGDGVTIDVQPEDSPVRIDNLGNGQFEFTYIGEGSIEDEHTIEIPVNFLDFNQNPIDSSVVAENVPLMGEMTSRMNGVAPIDASYIYSWKGGRKHYLVNEASQEKLALMFSGSVIRHDATKVNSNTHNQIQNTQSAKIENKTVQGEAPEPSKPVTKMPVKPTVNKPTSNVVKLLMSKGFKAQPVPKLGMSYVKGAVVVAPSDNKIAVNANIFTVSILGNDEWVKVNKVDLINDFEGIIRDSVAQLKGENKNSL